MNNQYIKPNTKTNIIVASVFAGVAFIALIMLVLLLGKPAKETAIMACSVSVVVAFIITFWVGVLQIKIFQSYKSQRKYLCAEGVFTLCLTILVVITGILFCVLQADGVLNNSLKAIDLRWFLGIFFLGFCAWKIAVILIAIKEKHFNLWLEIVNAILWLGLAIVTFISIFAKGDATIVYFWIFSAISWLLIANYVAYILISYVFKSPDYLDTPEAQALLQKDIEIRNRRLEKVSEMLGGTQTEQPKLQTTATTEKPDIESRLKKLDALLKSGILTQEEYDEKRKKIIDESL